MSGAPSVLAVIRQAADQGEAGSFRGTDAARLRQAGDAVADLIGTEDTRLAMEQAAAMLRHGLVAVKAAERRRIATALEAHAAVMARAADGVAQPAVDPRHLPPNTVGAIDHETGRVCVSVADYAGSDLNGDAPAYWLTPDARDHGADPWALVDGVDPYAGGAGFDVWFANGKSKSVAGPTAVLYLSAKDAARLVKVSP